METQTNPPVVFDAKQRHRGWFLLRIAIVLMVLGYLSAKCGVHLLEVIATLGLTLFLVLTVRRFNRDNREFVKVADYKAVLATSFRSLRLVVFVFGALIPGIVMHLALSKAVDSGVSHIDSQLNRKIEVVVNSKPFILDDFKGWLLYSEIKEYHDEIQGLKAWTLVTLKEALLWLDRLFAAYLIFVAIWLWARFTARLFIGQSGNVRFSLKDHP
jgi:hypothetical protein